jgi:hypothetical protein
MRPSALERRWFALIRSRLTLLGVAGLGSLAAAFVFALALPEDQRLEAIGQVVMFGCALVVPILAHGMISADLRSGVAMLWLQKPVRPLGFYASRGAEVTALAVVTVLALWGTGSALIAASVGLDAARGVLASAPGAVLLVVCICALTFAFSSWGVPTDSLFALVVFVAGTLSLAAGGPLVPALEWLAVPVDPIMDLMSGRSAVPLWETFWRVARFLGLWVAVGVAGLALSTRSPLPNDSAR